MTTINLEELMPSDMQEKLFLALKFRKQTLKEAVSEFLIRLSAEADGFLEVSSDALLISEIKEGLDDFASGRFTTAEEAWRLSDEEMKA